MISAYDEVANFMASISPLKVIDFKPSKNGQDRFDFLSEKKKSNIISEEELIELHNYIISNRIICLAKAKAHDLLKK